MWGCSVGRGFHRGLRRLCGCGVGLGTRGRRMVSLRGGSDRCGGIEGG